MRAPTATPVSTAPPSRRARLASIVARSNGEPTDEGVSPLASWAGDVPGSTSISAPHASHTASPRSRDVRLRNPRMGPALRTWQVRRRRLDGVVECAPRNVQAVRDVCH